MDKYKIKDCKISWYDHDTPHMFPLCSEIDARFVARKFNELHNEAEALRDERDKLQSVLDDIAIYVKRVNNDDEVFGIAFHGIEAALDALNPKSKEDFLQDVIDAFAVLRRGVINGECHRSMQEYVSTYDDAKAAYDNAES